MKTSRNDKGFTLIETAVAFAIAAFALTAILRLLQSGYEQIDESEKSNLAVSYARSLLAEIRGTRDYSIGHRIGTFENGWSWQMSVDPYHHDIPSAASTGMKPVSVKIHIYDNSQQTALFELGTVGLSNDD